MERTQTIGFVLIFVVLMVWLWLNTPPPEPVSDKAPIAASTDSARSAKPTAVPERAAETMAQEPEKISLGKFFDGRDSGQERLITVETDLYRAVLSTRGGVIQQWELKKYNTWNGYPVQLVRFTKGDLGVLFGTTDGKTVASRELYFDTDAPERTIVLDEKNFKFEINFILPAANGGRMIKTYSFQNDTYGTDVRFTFDRMEAVLANYAYEITWENGVPYAEHNTVDESGFGAAFALAGGELAEVDASTVGEHVEKSLSGQVDWVGIRNKYFAVALIPTTPQTEGALLEGNRRSVPDNGVVEDYGMSLRMPFKGSPSETSMVRVFLGPLDHGIVGDYNVGLESMMSLGWAWIIRPIAEYIFLPLFTGIHYFFPNWGIVIIVFSILIKIALHPLTKTQMKSMKRMQALQPMMEELKEKY